MFSAKKAPRKKEREITPWRQRPTGATIKDVKFYLWWRQQANLEMLKALDPYVENGKIKTRPRRNSI